MISSNPAKRTLDVYHATAMPARKEKRKNNERGLTVSYELNAAVIDKMSSSPMVLPLDEGTAVKW